MKTIKKIGVVGSGLMGTGITFIFAQNGYQVQLMDKKQSNLQNSINYISELSKIEVIKENDPKKEKMTLERIALTTSISDFYDIDLVVEAVDESLEIKKSVFKELDQSVGNETLLTSNTSCLSITDIASVVSNPQRVAGLHFFNPAQNIPLVEIIRGSETGDETIEFLKFFAKSINKEAIEVKKDVPGFIVNRIMISQYIESIRLLEEGIATTEDIDKAVREVLNQPMGVFELQDLSGNDHNYELMNFFQKYFRDDKWEPPQLLRKMVEKNQLGKKTGRGFYEYS